MPTLTPPKSPARKWLESLDAGNLQIYGWLCNAAQLIETRYVAFWTLPDEEINAVFAELGPERVGYVFATHNAAAIALNGMLAALGASLDRVPLVCSTTSPRQVEMGLDGNLVLVPLPVEPDVAASSPPPPFE